MNAPTTPRKPLVVGWLYEGIVPPVFTDSVVIYREWLRQGHENISPVIRKSDADAYYVPDGEVRVECAPDPRGVGIGVWVGSRCIYSGAHAVPPGAPAPAADDAPPRFTISASDRFELTGAVGLLRGYGCAGAADALQRTLDAEMASFSVQREDAASDAQELNRKTDLIAELSKIIHNMTVAQQAAWIEWQHGAGAEAGMRWIANGLAGPGHIPEEDEPYGTEAQAYFDANQADPLPACHCGRPSNILHMGNGYCSQEHYAAAIAAQQGEGGAA
ncbi:hypothetical protein [Bordetella bronchiseptica]|uniref:hypothetical protein n=1 Tax=Bordetella bronchiseptica TaxID=518 RepID=UPI001239DC65|nr:hypothetical protein [Bordetella bronchiseptica]QET71410.1 hypothetical protein FOB42_14295 [Bordetella bronchiseptica]